MNRFHFSHWALTLAVAVASTHGLAASPLQLRTRSLSHESSRVSSSPAAHVSVPKLQPSAEELLGETSARKDESFSLFQTELQIRRADVEREGAMVAVVPILLIIAVPLLVIVLAYFFLEVYKADSKSGASSLRGGSTAASSPVTSSSSLPWPATLPAGQRLLQPEISHNASPPASAVAVPFVRGTFEGAAPTKQFAKVSSSSQALVVQTPEGVVLQTDRILTPRPEQCNVNFRSLKGANAVIRARAAEYAGGDSKIRVESASGVALAHLDTTAAFDKQSGSARRVVIHRVVGSSWDVIGPPCAAVIATSQRSFSVRNIVDGIQEPDSLFVQCYPDGRLQTIQDTSGNMIARHEPVGHRGGDPRNTVWVTHGADVAMVVSIWLAAQKLV